MTQDKRREKEVEKIARELMMYNNFWSNTYGTEAHMRFLARHLLDRGFGSSKRFEIGEILKPAKGLRIEHWEQSIKPIQYSLEKE